MLNTAGAIALRGFIETWEVAMSGAARLGFGATYQRMGRVMSRAFQGIEDLKCGNGHLDAPVGDAWEEYREEMACRRCGSVASGRDSARA